MSEWVRKLVTLSSVFEEGDLPLAVIFLDKNNVLSLRIENNFVEQYRKVSPDGRAWMDAKN